MSIVPGNIVTLLIRLRSEISRELAAAKIELPISFIEPLKFLQAFPSSTPLQLAMALCRDKGQITRVINDCCEWGLTTKSVHPDDRRSQVVELTAKGKKLLAQVSKIENRVLEDITRGIPQEEISTFNQALEAMVENTHDRELRSVDCFD